MQYAVFITVVLHEHVVPDFDVAITIFFRRAWRAAGDFRTVIEEDFRAGAAGACVAHRPEIVRVIFLTALVAYTRDSVLRDTDFIRPNRVRLVVVLIDGDPEFFLWKFQCDGQELPGKANGIVLEIIAKAEVAQHFEESVVACGVTDVFQIIVFAASTHTALAGRSSNIGT